MKKKVDNEESASPGTSGGKAGRGRNKEFTDNIIRDSKTAKERGAKGGQRSQEVQRVKRDAQSSARYMLDLATKGVIDKNLKELGYAENERTNMAALHAKLLTMAMAGDLQAYIQLMKTAGTILRSFGRIGIWRDGSAKRKPEFPVSRTVMLPVSAMPNLRMMTAIATIP